MGGGAKKFRKRTMRVFNPALKYKGKGGVAIFIVASLVKNQPLTD
jgi:hypothetical protein